jgi:hypothetical protein
MFGADVLSQGERDRAMSALHASRKMFLDAVEGLSEAQWKFKPDDKTWSIAECAEHIAVSEDSLFELATKKVMSMPVATAEVLAQTKDKDGLILEKLVDRSKKATAPEFLRPTNRWTTRDELVAHFKQSRDRNIAYVRTTQEDLRHHATPHPAFGALDAYQWILLLAGHSERHTLQILEVKQNSGYPK